MGKRHAAADSSDQYETPQKRHKVSAPTAAVAAAAASPFLDSSLSASPALNVSFTLTREFVDGTILTDLALKDWRIGKPIGKGSFGEIFLASDNVFKPVTSETAKYVVKIEPHSNGPLFVEIHALLNTAKRSESNPIPAGMPEYIASGSHYFKNERYRFLILKRYQRDLHSLIKNRRVDPASVPVIALQILDVLEHLHDKGYVHSDIKAENLMIGKVPAAALLDLKSSKCFQEQESSPVKQPKKPKHLNGLTCTPTVVTKKSAVSEFSGSNPVRACRNGNDEFVTSGTYQDMVKSHYLRPLKNIVYRDDSDEEEGKNGKKKRKKSKKDGDTSKSFFYTITTKNVSENFKQIDVQVSRNGASLVVETPKSAKNGVNAVMEERIHLIDFGLASKFIDSSGQHRPFCMDQRRAHDGTLEFTSRDAHMGAHARRSDLECLGYNLIYWSRGFLPWKDEKMLNQPEQVHRMKEYFMTDVREMLKLIYGEDCPKYLGEFLHYVGGLNYDDRPDYDFLRSLFCQELRRLGQKPRGPYLKLNVQNIAKLSEPLTAQDEAEITNKINHVKSLMKMGVLPYRESTLHNKTTSPKNLRSKRDSTRTPAGNNGATTNGKNGASTAKKEKPFSWSEILSTDPDQIARERAEKEFERADLVEEVVIKYTGNPTYAIRELESKRESGIGGGLEYTESEGYIRGYTKPMMDILRKRQSQLIREVYQERDCGNGVKEPPDEEEEEEPEEENEDEVEEEPEEEVEQNEEVEEAADSSDNESVCSDAASEADSGNDDVDGEEEEEEEEGAVEQEEEVEEESASDRSEVVRRKGKGRRRLLQSESSDQQDSDFNDQESSELENREVRVKKSRGRPRLNRDQPKSGTKPPHSADSKATVGANTKVPVIARNNNNNHKPYYGDVDDSSHDVPTSQQKFLLLKRRKSGLRERIRPTDRSAKYHDDLALKKSKRSPRKRYSDDEDYCQVDDSSCSSSQSTSSIGSEASTATTASSGSNSDFSNYRHKSSAVVRKSSRKRIGKRSFSSSSRSVVSHSSRASSVHNGASNGPSEPAVPAPAPVPPQQRPSAFAADEDEFFDDDDTRDMDYSPCKAKRGRKPLSASARRNGAVKKRIAEVKGPAAAAAKANGGGGGVVAGLRGRRGDHQVRTYSRG